MSFSRYLKHGIPLIAWRLDQYGGGVGRGAAFFWLYWGFLLGYNLSFCLLLSIFSSTW